MVRLPDDPRAFSAAVAAWAASQGLAPEDVDYMALIELLALRLRDTRQDLQLARDAIVDLRRRVAALEQA